MEPGYNVFKTENLTNDALLQMQTLLDEAENMIALCKGDKYLSTEATEAIYKKFCDMAELALKLDRVARSVDELKSNIRKREE